MRDRVLYIHPYGHVLDELVPMGAVALMNRVPGPKAGRYAWEVREEDVRDAAVIAMDLHWYFAIEAVGWIAADLKRMAPETPIVLGGITAGFYAKHLLEVFPIDFVVQGDGEEAFPRLIEALREGRTPALPNVWSRRGPPPERRPVRPSEYDANDYLTLDWFPSLLAETHAAHAEYVTRPFWGRMDRYHPYVPLNRGCRFPCNGCFGSYQHDVFGPGQVDRSAESLGRLLDRIEADPQLRFVSLTAGTEDLARLAAYRGVLGRRRDLGAYVMHFCDLPSDADLQLLLDGFARVCIDFTNPEDVPLPLRAKGLDTRAAEDRILDVARALDGRDDVRVGVSFMSTAPHRFKDRLRRIDWQTLEIKENSEWTLPRPNHATLALPDRPVPALERRGLAPAQLRARDDAKAAQAEAFRDVSRGHARYLLARSLSPALHPLLDRSYLQHVDGTPREDLVVDGDAATFLAGYVERYQRWYVTTLPSVDVVVAAVDDEGEPGLREVASWGQDLGEAAVRPALDGLRIAWEGEVEAPAVAVRTVLPREDGGRFDPRDVPGLVHWVLRVPRPGRVRIEGRASSASGELVLLAGDERSEVRWDAPARPATPFEPPAAPEPASDEGPAPVGPGNLVSAPFPDDVFPARVARAIDLLVTRGMVAGWTATRGECSRRWVAHELVHASGVAVRTFAVPPGPEPCAIVTAGLRLVIQPVSDDALASPVTHELLRTLEGLLRRV